MDKQLITTEMLDNKLEGITFAGKMRTKSDESGKQKEATLELDYTGATLREVIAWAWKNRKIAYQDTLRVLGQDYINSIAGTTVEMLAVDVSNATIIIAMTPKALAAHVLSIGGSIEDTILELQAEAERLQELREADEKALLEGVDV